MSLDRPPDRLLMRVLRPELAHGKKKGSRTALQFRQLLIYRVRATSTRRLARAVLSEVGAKWIAAVFVFHWLFIPAFS